MSEIVTSEGKSHHPEHVKTNLTTRLNRIEGEDYYDFNEEKKCYDLVIESLLYQDKLIVEVLKKIEDDTASNPQREKFNKKMKEMLKAMKKSLKEKLGSVNKDFLQK